MSNLPLRSLNHISTVVRDVEESVKFFSRVLGFQEIRRPASLDHFGGAWLWRHNVALHLIEGTPVARPETLDPCSDHISFQADTSLEDCAHRLEALGIPFIQERVVEGGVVVDQLFFHSPDQLLIEICNCECLPILLLAGSSAGRCPSWVVEDQRKAACAVSAAASETSDVTPARMSIDSTTSNATAAS